MGKKKSKNWSKHKKNKKFEKNMKKQNYNTMNHGEIHELNESIVSSIDEKNVIRAEESIINGNNIIDDKEIMQVKDFSIGTVDAILEKKKVQAEEFTIDVNNVIPKKEVVKPREDDINKVDIVSEKVIEQTNSEIDNELLDEIEQIEEELPEVDENLFDDNTDKMKEVISKTDDKMFEEIEKTEEPVASVNEKETIKSNEFIENKKEKVQGNIETKKREPKIKVEKHIKCNSLKPVKKKSFIILLLKFIGIHIKNVLFVIGGFIKNIFTYLSDFFEDRAEDLDRKIREIHDEEVIKNKKRELKHERYNTKRMYKDIERAEKYRDRASSRVNTEKYFEDKIEEERINNRILVKKEIDEEQDKKNEERNKEENEDNEETNVSTNNTRKRDRIEKKKNEILELRRKKKEEKQKNKEERNREIEAKKAEKRMLEEKEAQMRAEEEKMISETEEIVKSLEEQFKLTEELEDDHEIYKDLFNEFGSEDILDEEDDEDDDVPDLDDIIKMAEEEDQIKNVNYKQIHEDRLTEPYERFEKENDVRQIDDKLKTEILRLMDVPENETTDDFITEISINPNINNKEITIGDLLGEEDDADEDDNKRLVDKAPSETRNTKNDPTISIFAALKNANARKKVNEEVKHKNENVSTITKVRISDNQDGFENVKMKSEKNNGNFYDSERLNVGSWKNKEKTEIKNEERNKVNENIDSFSDQELFLKYKNQEAYQNSIQEPIKEDMMQEEPEYTIESVFKDKDEPVKKYEKRKIKYNKRYKENTEQNNKLKKKLKTDTNKVASDFDEDLYTNKFIKNIIGIDNSHIANKESKKDDKEDLSDINDDIYYNTDELNEYILDNAYNKYQNEEENKTNILDMDNDDIDINDDEQEYIHEPNEYYDNILKKEARNDINYSDDIEDEIDYQNVKDERRNRVKNKKDRNNAEDEEYDDSEIEDKTSIGGFIKGVASNINSSIIGIPENMRRKRESKNRIKRNQIYSTSYNKKSKRK